MRKKFAAGRRMRDMHVHVQLRAKLQGLSQGTCTYVTAALLRLAIFDQKIWRPESPSITPKIRKFKKCHPIFMKIEWVLILQPQIADVCLKVSVISFCQLEENVLMNIFVPHKSWWSTSSWRS